MKVQGFLVFFVSLAALHSPASARAGDAADSSASLSSFVDQALKANPGLQAAQSRARGAQARIPQAGAWEDPQAGVEFFATPITSANPFKDGMETDYFILQMIPLFGKKGLMNDAASAGARMAEQTVFAADRNLRANVKKTYAMIFSAQRRIDVNIKNQQLLAQIVESARVKYSVGLATQGDVLKVQVELAKLQNEGVELEQELINAIAMMNALRSMPAATPIGHVADVPLAKISDTFEDLIARALENRPELRGMNYELEMNKAELAASERERLPDLMVRGMYKQMREGTDQWAAMFSINIPFAPWASGKYSGKTEENALAARATEQSLAEMRNMIQAEVRDMWAKTSSKWQQIERFRQAILPQAEQSLQSTLAAYETNRTDFLSLLDSYRMVQMLKMDYFMLVGEYFANVAQLERAIGSDLD